MFPRSAGVALFLLAACTGDAGEKAPAPGGQDTAGPDTAADSGTGGDTETTAPDTATVSPPPDEDGDGYDVTVDCNDQLATVHPGAAEWCGDGRDEDCDGTDPACISVGDVADGVIRGDAEGGSVGGAGDWIVHEGVALVLGERERFSAFELPLTGEVPMASADWTSPAPWPTFFETLEDVTGDGERELLLSDHEVSDADDVVLLRMYSGEIDATTSFDASDTTIEADGRTSWPLSVLYGTWDGTGSSGLAVLCEYIDGGYHDYLVGGIVQSPLTGEISLDDARSHAFDVGMGFEMNMALHQFVAGDLNGDGSTDFFAESNYANDAYYGQRVQGWFGPFEPGGTTGGWDVELASVIADGDITSGDVDGDGADDLVVGTSGTLDYATDGDELIEGNVSLLTYADVETLHDHRNATNRLVGGEGTDFGDSVEIGDLNDDGAADLVVGSSCEGPMTGTDRTDRDCSKSRVYLFLGPFAGVREFTSADLVLDDDDDDYLGGDTLVGDFDGDGTLDLAASASGDDTLTRDGGALYFLWDVASHL